MDVRRLRSGGADDRRRPECHLDAIAAQLRACGAVPTSASDRSQLVIDVSILAVSVVALIGAATTGALSSHSNPVAAAAPAVVALATSVIAIRIVEYLCRRLSTATLDSSAVATFLAVRRIGRRPTAAARGTDPGDRGRPRLLRGVCVVGRAIQSAHRRDVLDRCAHGRHRHRGSAAARSGGRRRRPTRAFRHGGDRDLRPRARALIGVDATRLAAVAEWPGGTTHEERRRGQPRTDPEEASSTSICPRRVGGFGQRVGLRGGEPGSGAPATSRPGCSIRRTGRSSSISAGCVSAGPPIRASRRGTAPAVWSASGCCSSAKRVPSSGQIHLGLHALTYRSGAGVPQRDLLSSPRRPSGARARPVSVSSQPAPESASTFR